MPATAPAANGAQAQTCRTVDASVPRVLVIAGSDSGGGAGVQADIKSCMACGVYASTAITALTAQNTHGVDAVHVPPVDTLRAQVRAVLRDIGASAIKTGMLPDAECVHAVVDELEQHARTLSQATSSGGAAGASDSATVVEKSVDGGERGSGGETDYGGTPRLVVDPVMVSTSGHSLAATDVCAAMRQRLLPLAAVVTPNVAEASALLGAHYDRTLPATCLECAVLQ